MDKSEQTNFKKYSFYGDNSEDIDLKKLFNFFWRQKKKILSSTIGITSLIVLLTYTQKNIWEGELEILAEKIDAAGKKGNKLIAFPSFTEDQSQTKTKEGVLISPYILGSVYNFIKEESKESNYKIGDFKGWLSKDLTVKFKDKTNLLNVKLRHPNKELILVTLDKISKKYQDYSKEDQIKSILNGIEFLKVQTVALEEKSKNSLKDFNKFSLKHGLGNIDGFIELDQEFNKNIINKESISADDILKVSKRLNIKDNNSGQRFKSQLKTLEGYELLFTNLNDKLKPESKTLKNLDNQIKKFKKSLKRPNEILIKYMEKKRNAERDLNLLSETEERLSMLQFEKARKQESWLIISKPNILPSKFYPKRSQALIVSFSLSIIISSLLLFLKEKREGIIYDFEDLKNNLKFKFIDTLFKNEDDLNNLTIENALTLNDKKVDLKKSRIGCIFVSKQFKNNIQENSENKFSVLNKQIDIKIEDKFELDKSDLIILFLEIGNVTYDQLVILEKYLKPYEEKILGWFFIDKETKINK